MTNYFIIDALVIFFGVLGILLIGHFLMKTWEEKENNQTKETEHRLLEKKTLKDLLIKGFPLLIPIKFLFIIWFLLGTFLLFLLTMWEKFSVYLMRCSEFKGLKEWKVNNWFKFGVGFTLLWPITFQFLVIIEFVVFFYAFIAVILGTLRKIIRSTWDYVTALWDNISDWFN